MRYIHEMNHWQWSSRLLHVINVSHYPEQHSMYHVDLPIQHWRLPLKGDGNRQPMNDHCLLHFTVEYRRNDRVFWHNKKNSNTNSNFTNNFRILEKKTNLITLAMSFKIRVCVRK